ncbi:hypothetical protein [Streptomyces sp. NPDC050738]|uniref:hypothetical protein n=1 Tax=Streptomyces sp. NPDC050738 TaxID=3154744 RepID=UPI0034443CA5
MYGPAPSIKSGNMAVRVSVRVLLTICALGTIGILSCGPLFRVASLRRRWWDWTIATVSVPLGIGCFATVGTVEETNHWGDAALVVLMLMGVSSATYYLIVDLQHPRVPRRLPAPAPYFGPRTTLGQYGPYQPYAETVPVAPPVQPVAPQSPPQLPPQPQHPIPQPRIDQVRAELDELSDLLRKRPEGPQGQGR